MTNSSEPYNLAKRLLESESVAYQHLVKATRRKISPDHVHRLRIRIQRLLAALELASALSETAAPVKLMRQLKQTRRQTGQIRDLHVESALLNANPATDFHRFKSHLRHKTDKSEKKLFRRLDQISLKKQAKRITKSESALVSSSRNPLPSTAGRRLGSALKLASLRLEKTFPDDHSQQPENLHHFRRKAKKLRYLAEAQKRVFGRCGVSIYRLKNVQGLLGRVQNDAALIANVESYLSHKKNKNDLGAKALLGETQADQTRLIESTRRWLKNKN